MGKRPRVGGFEEDAFDRVLRKYINSFRRAGKRKAAKKQANRRERRAERHKRNYG